MENPAISIVIPYFGKWPFWMPLFLKSCRFNHTFNWLIYTDCGIPDNCPDNVRMVEISFDAYNKKISDQLAINFRPKSPYKLCDIKPALGYIHAQELENYDYWGFGDIDLVYGDLRAYFTAQRLAAKDLFSTHHRRISGHLCIIRNTEMMRCAFMRVANWRDILSDDEHLAFDEKGYTKIFLRHKNSPHWVKAIASWLDPWLQRGEFIEAYSTPNARIPWTDNSKNYPRYWYWQQGHLTNDVNGDREFPYFHFFIWKNNWKAEMSDQQLPKSWENGVQISENGFTSRNENFK